jgi:hypothetical protein
MHSWRLPEGLSDVIAFQPSELVVLFRWERRQDGNPAAQTTEPFQVCRIRSLRDDGEARLLAETDCFDASVSGADAPADGSFFVVEGARQSPAGIIRSIKSFDGTSGSELWHRELHKKAKFGPVSVSPYGEEVVFFRDDGDGLVVYDTKSKTERLIPRPWPQDFGPSGYWVHFGAYDASPGGGVQLFSRLAAHPEPLVRLGMDEMVSSLNAATDAAGRYLAWGNADGTVSVCDLTETRKRLRTIYLDWDPPLTR